MMHRITVIGMRFLAILFYVGFVTGVSESKEIQAYHFHPFFQDNEASTKFAIQLRSKVKKQIEAGVLKGCTLGPQDQINFEPDALRPFGNFRTCCNRTYLTPAMSWFMQNRGELSVLFHSLTNNEVLDRTEATWLGDLIPLDLEQFMHVAPPCYGI